MDPRLAAILPLIPERVARLSSGSALVLPDAAACAYPERVAHLARFLHWLSPLEPLSKDDQRALGLVAANGRPVTGSNALVEEGPEEGLEEALEEEVFEDAAQIEPPEYERQGALGTPLAP